MGEERRTAKDEYLKAAAELEAVSQGQATNRPGVFWTHAFIPCLLASVVALLVGLGFLINRRLSTSSVLIAVLLFVAAGILISLPIFKILTAYSAAGYRRSAVVAVAQTKIAQDARAARTHDAERKEREAKQKARVAEAQRKRQAIRREQFFRERAERTKMGLMTGTEFELFVAEVYRRKGSVVQLTSHSGDEGIDIIMTDDKRKVAVQCKRQAKPVAQRALRELLGSMVHAGSDHAMFVTNNTYTKQAMSFASANDIELVDGDELLQLAKSTVDNAGSEGTSLPGFAD